MGKANKPLPKPTVEVERELKVRITIKGTQVTLNEQEAEQLRSKLDDILDSY